MKHLIAIVWQSILLSFAAFVGFLVGISVPSLRVYRVISHTLTNIRTYDFDWLIAVLLVYFLLLLTAVIRKRLRITAATATIALIIVVVGVVLFTQLGIKNTNI